MALNVSINAEIVDIRNDEPKPSDQFIVDTNVWYWMTYSKASHPGRARPYQINDYPHYLQEALVCGSGLKYTGLNMTELAHIIERTENDIFSQQKGSSVSLKEFRHNHPAERASTCMEISSVCGQIKSMANIVDVSIDDSSMSGALSNLNKWQVDGYDLLISDLMINSGLTQLITDDADFASVSGITVFTANINLINSAKSAGKLKSRGS